VSQRDKVYIFDISNMIHRAFHATGELSTSKGFPTGAIWGTMNMMIRFIDKYKPTHMLICYDDQSGKSVRRQIYPEYKANRTQTNSVSAEELIIRRLFEMMNVASVKADGYEADDLIGTAVAKLKDHMDVVIVTGDKDMLQLIEPGVQVFDSMKNIWYDEKEALKKFGVKASQIADYLALAGDKADNIPGGAGIGPKAAQDLLSIYPSVENIISDLESTPLKYRDKLVKSKDAIEVSKKLTSLFQNLDVEITPESVIFQPIDNPEIFELFEKLEFRGMKVKFELMWQMYNE
jgi:DNA polymerase I